ncbi:sensor histidine kinase [Sphingobium phenoxybenzoativorans]|nr:HAMP domain-containing sensor histidine kinase [Sphingobium phenoxybenzoativorans]
MRRGFNPPILAGIVGLIAIALIAALCAMLAVTFRGPPPHARPLTMDEVAAAIRTGQSENSDWSLDRGQGVKQPSGMRPAPLLAKALALRLGVPEQNVRLYVAGPAMPAMGPRPGEGMAAFPFPGSPKNGSRPAFPMAGMGGRGPMLHDSFTVSWRNGDHWSWMTGERHGSLRWYAITISLMILIFALLLGPAYLVARRITNPIHRLAGRVTAVSMERREPLPVEGPPEVRKLGQAFNRMQAQLVGHVAERTAMLIAIAHDLRTPMMRLSFRLEGLPEKDRAKAHADLEEMRAMVTTLLDFVRSGDESLVMLRIDLAALVEALADDMTAMQSSVTMADPTRTIILGDAAALRRCIANVVDNAVRYAGNAHLSLGQADGHALLRVEDDGPGVSPDHLARLSEPFYRGEASRNRATGGVGLGLSIARSIMEKHGGAMLFENRDGGGLRVTMQFPLAQ